MVSPRFLPPRMGFPGKGARVDPSACYDGTRKSIWLPKDAPAKRASVGPLKRWLRSSKWASSMFTSIAVASTRFWAGWHVGRKRREGPASLGPGDSPHLFAVRWFARLVRRIQPDLLLMNYSVSDPMGKDGGVRSIEMRPRNPRPGPTQQADAKQTQTSLARDTLFGGRTRSGNCRARLVRTPRGRGARRGSGVVRSVWIEFFDFRTRGRKNRRARRQGRPSSHVHVVRARRGIPTKTERFSLRV
jgi:hypothetical protein